MHINTTIANKEEDKERQGRAGETSSLLHLHHRFSFDSASSKSDSHLRDGLVGLTTTTKDTRVIAEDDAEQEHDESVHDIREEEHATDVAVREPAAVGIVVVAKITRNHK